MQWAVTPACDVHSSDDDCTDRLISYIAKFDEYGIIIRDGGTASATIAFCPWCGTRLPESKRDRWFDELDAKGIDPNGNDVPPEYESAAWHLSKST